MPAKQTLEALLGPTNTGKTWFALERMKTHKDGIIGFPLRLLARENYDRLCKELGEGAIALVTGEEKIIPKTARFFCATVEAMPVDKPFAFMAIDEIQLCADPDRGHIFTDRLLHARGIFETLFLGSDTMRNLIEELLPDCRITTRPRLSQLSYTGYKKVSRLPRRSAAVAFSLEDVYQLADQIRQRRGGTAVVLGALSPRTRNAQVAMYQAGEVDYLVATDAIGMGLNMDIHHVALASNRKFDGVQTRKLSAQELGQIAGRAGRHMRDGTFGTTDRLNYLDEDVVDSIESHQFNPVECLVWRNADLDFSTPNRLIQTLEKAPPHPLLVKGYTHEDTQTLDALIKTDSVIVRATDSRRTRLLWDVCQVPDFRRTMPDLHHALLTDVYTQLCDGRLSDAYMHAQVQPLDILEGDADTLMSRLAHIRTFTYIATRDAWVENASAWQEKTRVIEDRLSDALHQALLQRFVDRRAAFFGKHEQDETPLLAGIKADGTVIVEGHEVGHLHGLHFEPLPDLKTKTIETVRVLTAAKKALKPEILKRMNKMLTNDTGHYSLSDSGMLHWQPQANNPLPGDAVARLMKGATLMAPNIALLETDELGGADRTALLDKMQSWLNSYIKTTLAPLFALVADESPLQGTARGIGFQLFEHLGVMHRNDLNDMIASLTPETRAGLRKCGVRLGPILVFLPALVKPAAITLRATLWGLFNDRILPMPRPADGRVSEVIPEDARPDRNFYRMIGYPIFGPRACRIDMLDRVTTDIYDSAKDGKFDAKHQYAEWLGANLDDMHAILSAMGHRRIKTDEPMAEQATETPIDNLIEGVELKSQKTPVPLIKFMLKRGNMADKPQSAKPVQKPAAQPEKRAERKPAAKPKQLAPEKPKPTPQAAVFSAPAQASSANPFSALQALKDRISS